MTSVTLCRSGFLKPSVGRQSQDESFCVVKVLFIALASTVGWSIPLFVLGEYTTLQKVAAPCG